ncbi:transcriptional regulator [Cohnella sp. AR92]|uniref:transcriptional regulator n=1 Tax=Cohnella sp. AR92 TaxID=648716 RepID=UPI000F8DB31C|nr:transcriptional regulator [Cohnella sp. AR92]RUS43902.1 transcriptional regulator [Cohnella sp. AR92]
MRPFDDVYAQWLDKQITEESNPRRKERLRRGLTHGTVVFLREIWFPLVANLDHLHAEYEVRDWQNGYRYLDLVFSPLGAKGCIEIQDYRSHARDIEIGRFKDLCMKQALLGLDDWLFLPIAYLSIREDPGVCKQLTLAFIGKFLAVETPPELNWAEAETIRFARRAVIPFAPGDLAAHLRLTDRHTRKLLHRMVDKKLLAVANGQKRYRTYRRVDQ